MQHNPRKATLSSQVSADLRRQILRGQLAPGAKINLDRLRAHYTVSISPLREAVTRLVADGLVIFEDQRGYHVAPVSGDDLDELTALRQLLEQEALSQSIAQGSLDWESEVVGALYRLENTPRGVATLDAWEDAHSAFHTVLLAGSVAPRLRDYCAALRLQNDRYRRLLLTGAAQIETAARVDGEHRAIADATVARNIPEAVALLTAHIAASGATLAGLLARSDYARA